MLQNKEVCKTLIEKLLELKSIVDIEYISIEESYQHSLGSKGVRFDVYVKDVKGVAYVVELQQTDTYEIEKRMRYYQSMMDGMQLKKGKDVRYRDLKNCYVIFIMKESLWDHGLHKYTFKNECQEVPGLLLNDGTTKVVFDVNGTGDDVNEDVKSFLKMVSGEVGGDTEFAKQIQHQADEVKADETWRRGMMQTLLREQDLIDKAEARGMAKGIEQEKRENDEKLKNSAVELLQDGLTVERVSHVLGLQLEVVKDLIKK